MLQDPAIALERGNISNDHSHKTRRPREDVTRARMANGCERPCADFVALCERLCADSGHAVLGERPCVDFSWQTQYFVKTHVQISWQAQRFVNLKARASFCEARSATYVLSCCEFRHVFSCMCAPMCVLLYICAPVVLAYVCSRECGGLLIPYVLFTATRFCFFFFGVPFPSVYCEAEALSCEVLQLWRAARPRSLKIVSWIYVWYHHKRLRQITCKPGNS